MNDKFDEAAWREKLFTLNPWARELTIDLKNAAFAAARQKETLARYAEGKEAWNSWAKGMLALKTTLEKAGLWIVEPKREPMPDLWDLVVAPSTRSPTPPAPERNEVSAIWDAVASAVFSKHRFETIVSCQGFVFPSRIHFDDATFGDTAHFDGATFSGPAFFHRTTFGQAAWFDKATFNSNAQFDETTFKDDARFDAATFSDNTWFDGATFDGTNWFINTTFRGPASFDNATFGGTNWFSKATFRGTASFDNATFGDDIWFTRATFRGAASFEKATFNDMAVFNETTFGGAASFNKATFRHATTFLVATFSDTARFDDATFGGAASFDKATFSDTARFDNATFGGASMFYKTTFSRSASFQAAAFKNLANFQDSIFRQVATFDGVDSTAIFSLANVTFKEVPSLFNATFKGKLRLDNVEMPRYPFGYTPHTDATARFRELRRLAAEAQDRERELEFFAQEIRTGRFHTKWPLWIPKVGGKALPSGVPKFWSWRFVFGLGFGALSDFGRSFWRPLLGWLALTAVCAVFFLGEHDDMRKARRALAPAGFFSSFVAYTVTTGHALAVPPACRIRGREPFDSTDAVTEAIHLSFKNALVFNIGSTDSARRTFGCLYGSEQDGVPVRVSTVSTVQALVSGLLIFLFALAVRNLLRLT